MVFGSAAKLSQAGGYTGRGALAGSLSPRPLSGPRLLMEVGGGGEGLLSLQNVLV